MKTINAQIVATRLRVAKNFMLLVDSGIDSEVAAEIVKKYKDIAFNEVRVADDKVVVCFKTCRSEKKLSFPIAA